MKARRSVGYCGSSGTNTPPALRMPSTAATISAERSTHSPTAVSGRTPRSRSARARTSERWSSSA